MVQQTIGIVLGGGGVRGVAHVPFLEKIARHDIKPTIISGVSSGAIIAAFYAAGVSFPEMKSFFSDNSMLKLSKFTATKAGIFNSNKYADLFRRYLPSTFEELSIPIIINATNLQTREIVRFDAGPLIEPLLASCAVPFVFAPMEIQNEMYVDGGILDNYPTEPILGKADKIIGHYIASPPRKEKSELNSSFKVSYQANQMMLHQANKHKFETIDLNIESPTGKYWIFNNKLSNTIYDESKEFIDNHELLNQFINNL